jgi:hypothetical protein
MKKCIGISVMIGLWFCLLIGKARATESNFSEVLTDGVYGGLAGGLVGGALLVFKDNPSDHLNYLSYGAAIGVLFGTAFGLVSASRSIAEIDGHKVVYRPPIPEISVKPGGTGRSGLTARVNFLTVRY